MREMFCEHSNLILCFDRDRKYKRKIPIIIDISETNFVCAQTYNTSALKKKTL